MQRPKFLEVKLTLETEKERVLNDSCSELEGSAHATLNNHTNNSPLSVVKHTKLIQSNEVGRFEDQKIENPDSQALE